MRRLAISTIAWSPAEDASVLEVLARHRVNLIETVPGRRGPHGCEVIAVQSLFWGTGGLSIFNKRGTSSYTALHYLSTLISVMSKGGVKKLVFGSPKQRDRTGLTYNQAFDSATTFFRRLAEVALERRVYVCIEPVPESYGCNFINTTEEAAELVLEIDRPSIRLQIDTGTMFCNGEDPVAVVQQYGELVGHIHISEHGLTPIGLNGTDHAMMAKAIGQLPPELPMSIEMLINPKLIPDVAEQVENSIIFVREAYGCE